MRLTVNVADPQHADRARQLEGADQALRQSFSGFELEAVAAEVQRSLDEIGVALTPGEVRGYAQAIRDREDFELTLR